MKAAPLSTYDDKMQWLRGHRDLWRGYLGHKDKRKRLIIAAMKRDGLISRNTYWHDVNLLGLIARVEESE